MQYYSIWAYFICMAIVLAVASAPMLATDERSRANAKRRSNIDGLRGFLAFGVVFHHGAVYHQYLQNGHWGPPPSPFYAALGPVSVGLFFTITAYLFWGRLDRYPRTSELDEFIHRADFSSLSAVSFRRLHHDAAGFRQVRLFSERPAG